MTTRLPLVRMSFGFASFTVSLLFIASTLGLLPDRQAAVLEGRKALCEEMAIHLSYSAQRGDVSTFEATTRAVVDRTPDLLSAAVRRANGQLLFEIGAHSANWHAAHDGRSSPTEVFVPIARDDGLWGTVELRFAPPEAGLWAPFGDPLYAAVGFVAVFGFAGYYLLLRMIFRSLNRGPGGVIPKRVRTALNTLVEGVVIVDDHQRIALANNAFAELVGKPADDLEGCDVSQLSWAAPRAGDEAPDLPWLRALQHGSTELGTVLALGTDSDEQHTLSVNATPIVADDGTPRGAMATFDNLTTLEKKNARLRRVLHKLKHSRAEIRRQNEMLRTLATRDPLTNCLNRRAFFEAFETHWSGAARYTTPLSCIMVDIDHFKSINDTHGHATGDQVLQHVSRVMNGMLRQTDVLCRYGGEEFCVLLPGVDLDGAASAAERFRAGIEASRCGHVTVTASLGVSAINLGAREPRELLNQADAALYASKRGGRNRYTCWSAALDVAEKPAPESRHARVPEPRPAPISIPFHAVTALVAALGYRHADTAEHSQRVADLCVAAADHRLSQGDCYVLEVAALLHDIGKLGVPDAVLLKPGPLNKQEWKVIRTHEGIGEAIISSAFSCDELTDIICKHHCWYGGTPHDLALPRGEDIPLGARLLSIADAYDAMVSDRVYRKGRPRAEAFAELRRCAGTQFDPELVEHFISAVLARSETRATPTMAVSKQTALKLGVQIEKLANALDANDNESLALMASHLNATANMHDIAPIAAAAARLQQSAHAASDPVAIAQMTIELIDLCRSTYRAYLPIPASDAEISLAPRELVGCASDD